MKEEAGLEGYTRSMVAHEKGQQDYLTTKKLRKMCKDDRCVLCNNGEIKDLEDFLIRV